MRIATTISFLLIALTLGLASPAFAQRDEPKVRLTLGGGITAGAINADAALNVSAGYRFSKLFSFDVEVVAIDGGESPDLVAKLGVRGFPTFLGVVDGKVVRTRAGFAGKRALETMSEELLAL